jgi:lipopolysaccharide export system permease protein
MNYTIREAHNLFGRGLDYDIVFMLYVYNLAPIFALAVPMSVLVASSMAASRLAADSEVTILRSSGVSLLHIMRPVFFAAVSIAIIMFYFNNTILPEFNTKSASLGREISRLKPTVQLYEETFTDIQNIRLYVKRLDDTFTNDSLAKKEILGTELMQVPVDHMFEVIITDFRSKNSHRTIFADEGYVYLNVEKQLFEFILLNGEIYDRNIKDPNKFQRTAFKKTIFLMEASDYVRSENNNDLPYKSNRAKKLSELATDITREESVITHRINNSQKDYYVNPFYLERSHYDNLDRRLREERRKNDKSSKKNEEFISKKSKENNEQGFVDYYSHYQEFLSAQIKSTESLINMNEYTSKSLQDILGEYQKKFAIPFASIVFALIGAPLGLLSRKGELGAASFINLLVFIIYYVGLVIGEDLVDNNKVHYIIGIWSGNIIGICLAIWGLILLTKEKSIADYRIFQISLKKKT